MTCSPDDTTGYCSGKCCGADGESCVEDFDSQNGSSEQCCAALQTLLLTTFLLLNQSVPFADPFLSPLSRTLVQSANQSGRSRAVSCTRHPAVPTL